MYSVYVYYMNVRANKLSHYRSNIETLGKKIWLERGEQNDHLYSKSGRKYQDQEHN